MRTIALMFAVLCAACSFAVGQEQKPVTVGPILWTTAIEGFGVHGGEASAVKSILTPETEITITRMEAYDEQGPRLAITGLTTEFVPCSPQPTLSVTDGVTSYTLQLSSTFLPKSPATYSDSGPLKLRFPAGSQIRLVISPPPTRQPALCMSKGFSVLVHYTSRSQ
jgi:hypothetical protein